RESIQNESLRWPSQYYRPARSIVTILPRANKLTEQRQLLPKIRVGTASLDTPHHGYYNIPRAATAREIARRLRTPRTSFADHLRKAESKVVQAVGPYLRLRSTKD